MNGLTSFQRDLLYAVAAGDSPHGLAIKEVMEEYYQQEINHGRLYPNLDKLEERGLIEKGEIDQRTNSYTLTERGTELLLSRREWENEEAGELIEE